MSRRMLFSREAVLLALVLAVAMVSTPDPVLTAVIAIVAIGQLFVTATGGIDLSVGPLAALMAGITDVPLSQAIPLALAVGILCGLINGLVVTRTPVPPYMATVGMAALLIGVVPAGTASGSSGSNAIVWVAAAVAVAAHIVLTRTRLGIHMFFVGSNENSARLSGIMPTRVKILAYVVSAVLACLAGALATPSVGTGLRLDLSVIIAVVIGGVSLSGGRGTVLGTVLGSVLCVQLLEAMVEWDISEYGRRCGQITLLLLVITYNEWRTRNPAAGRVSTAGGRQRKSAT